MYYNYLSICKKKGCNITLWQKVRFQQNGEAHCYFHLPNSQRTRSDFLIEIAISNFNSGQLINDTCTGGYLKVNLSILIIFLELNK